VGAKPASGAAGPPAAAATVSAVPGPHALESEAPGEDAEPQDDAEE
jgi:hypothetical protein